VKNDLKKIALFPGGGAAAPVCAHRDLRVALQRHSRGAAVPPVSSVALWHR
ncbi:hypothetical protein TorRG33x02_191260, partial [Trema orientale]